MYTCACVCSFKYVHINMHASNYVYFCVHASICVMCTCSALCVEEYSLCVCVFVRACSHVKYRAGMYYMLVFVGRL